MNGHADALFFAAPSARGFSPYRNAVCIDQSTFRDYFVAALLVPLLRNGANQELSSHKSSKKKEMPKQCFRDYFAPSGLVPLLRNGANQELSSHKSSKKKEMQKQCFKDYFVAALLVPLLRNGANQELSSHKSSKKKEMQSFQGLLRPFGARAAFGGANRHPRTTVRSPLPHRSDVVLPLKAQPKKMRNAKAFLIFLVHFQGLEPWAH